MPRLLQRWGPQQSRRHNQKDRRGRQRIVRNGHHQPREIQTGIGADRVGRILQSQAVRSPGRDQRKTFVRRGYVALTPVISAPGHERSVGLQTQAVVIHRGDRGKTPVGLGDTAVAIGVPTSRYDASVVLEGKTVEAAALHGNEPLVR